MKRFRAAFLSLAVLTNFGIGVVAAVAQTGGNKVEATTHCTVPPGQFHKEVPEPDIEFWGTMNRL